MELSCHSCNHSWTLAPNSRILRSDECDKCYSDLHVCIMCKFYEQNSYNECKESNADRVVEKNKKNFCDYFEITDKNNNSSKIDQSKYDAANALFKD